MCRKSKFRSPPSALVGTLEGSHEGLEEAQKDLVGAPGGLERAPGGLERL